MQNFSKTVSYSEYRAQFLVDTKRIKPNGLGLELFGIQARVRWVGLKQNFLLSKFSTRGKAC